MMMVSVRWIVFFVLLACFVGAGMATDLPSARYQEYPCQFDAIYRQTGPIDVAVVGNSRTRRAVVVEQLTAALADAGVPLTPDPVMYDLSRNWRGQEHEYVMVRDLLEHRPVGLLLVEYNLNPGRTRRYHPHTPFTARIDDLAVLQLTERTGSAVERASLFLRHVLDRLSLRAEQGLTLSFRPLASSEVRAAECTDCTEALDLVTAERNLQKREEQADRWAGRPYGWSLESDDEHVTTTYTSRIIELARLHDVPVVLFLVPRLYNQPLKPEFIEEVAGFYGVPFLVPPPDLLAELYEPGRFRDPTHMNPAGSALYARWLAAELRAAMMTGPDR